LTRDDIADYVFSAVITTLLSIRPSKWLAKGITCGSHVVREGVGNCVELCAMTDHFEEEIEVRQDVACEHSEEEDIARLTAEVFDRGDGIGDESVENETDAPQNAVAE